MVSISPIAGLGPLGLELIGDMEPNGARQAWDVACRRWDAVHERCSSVDPRETSLGWKADEILYHAAITVFNMGKCHGHQEQCLMLISFSLK